MKNSGKGLFKRKSDPSASDSNNSNESAPSSSLKRSSTLGDKVKTENTSSSSSSKTSATTAPQVTPLPLHDLVSGRLSPRGSGSMILPSKSKSHKAKSTSNSKASSSSSSSLLSSSLSSASAAAASPTSPTKKVGNPRRFSLSIVPDRGVGGGGVGGGSSGGGLPLGGGGSASNNRNQSQLLVRTAELAVIGNSQSSNQLEGAKKGQTKKKKSSSSRKLQARSKRSISALVTPRALSSRSESSGLDGTRGASCDNIGETGGEEDGGGEGGGGGSEIGGRRALRLSATTPPRKSGLATSRKSSSTRRPSPSGSGAGSPPSGSSPAKKRGGSLLLRSLEENSGGGAETDTGEGLSSRARQRRRSPIVTSETEKQAAIMKQRYNALFHQPVYTSGKSLKKNFSVQFYSHLGQGAMSLGGVGGMGGLDSDVDEQTSEAESEVEAGEFDDEGEGNLKSGARTFRDDSVEHEEEEEEEEDEGDEGDGERGGKKEKKGGSKRQSGKIGKEEETTPSAPAPQNPLKWKFGAEEGKGVVFGVSLDDIMKLQKNNKAPPAILVRLTKAIVRLGGCQMEGIFRVSGTVGSMQKLKENINQGNHRFPAESTNPYDLASLVKEWLRSLTVPLIPKKYYRRCIESVSRPSTCLKIIQDLPRYNRQTLRYLVLWLQHHLLKPNVQSITRMDISNIAMVFAPCILEAPKETTAETMLASLREQIKFTVNMLMLVGMEDTNKLQKKRLNLSASARSLTKQASQTKLLRSSTITLIRLKKWQQQQSKRGDSSEQDEPDEQEEHTDSDDGAEEGDHETSPGAEQDEQQPESPDTEESRDREEGNLSSSSSSSENNKEEKKADDVSAVSPDDGWVI